MVGLSRNAIEARVRSGEFPAPFRLGGPRARALGWRKADVDRLDRRAHLLDRQEKRRGDGHVLLERGLCPMNPYARR